MTCPSGHHRTSVSSTNAFRTVQLHKDINRWRLRRLRGVPSAAQKAESHTSQQCLGDREQVAQAAVAPPTPGGVVGQVQGHRQPVL
ncbi:hypothetical protein HPB48_001580 [Haemaphysalis longicornis]|uniref:Uncharacterized protein n=1 Tax=Haemaphysalis longicornis TaxID=44386 RepID=A0A9J6F760_HAELO|nr:hypothetical protein HPB48_001580 [Haemaphysalis longicornis]